MPSLPLKRLFFSDNQLVTGAVLRTLSQDQSDSLYLAMKYAYGLGFLNAGTLEVVTNSLTAWLRAPIMAITSGGLAIYDTDKLLTFGAGDGTHDRRDRVSIGFLETQGNSQATHFLNDSDEDVESPTDTTYYQNQAADIATWLQVTAGKTDGTLDADGLPAVNDLPAGHIELWRIIVPHSATDLNGATTTKVASAGASGKGYGQQRLSDSGYGAKSTPASYNTGDDLIHVQIPAGFMAVLIGSASFVSPTPPAGPPIMTWHWISNSGSTPILGGAASAIIDVSATSLTTSVQVIGTVIGPVDDKFFLRATATDTMTISDSPVLSFVVIALPLL